MTFPEHYKAAKKEPHITPARRFIMRIASATERTEKTVYQWLTGCQRIPKDMQDKISDELGTPVEQLFPEG